MIKSENYEAPHCNVFFSHPTPSNTHLLGNMPSRLHDIYAPTCECLSEYLLC